MTKVLTEDVIQEVLAIVNRIPLGKVATYGQIAQLIGRPRNARLVGKVLSIADEYGKYPCHRVVNQAGRLAPDWEEQRYLLWAEGVFFKRSGLIDMKRCQWQPEKDLLSEDLS